MMKSVGGFILAFTIAVLGPVAILSTANAQAQTYMLLPIKGVYDGDTIYTDLTWRLPAPLNEMSVRIRGIDTPERGWRADCEKEALLAERARQMVIDTIGTATTMKITNYDWDKYARIDADVSVNGVDLGQVLILNGLAVPYDGGTKTHNWCL